MKQVFFFILFLIFFPFFSLAQQPDPAKIAIDSLALTVSKTPSQQYDPLEAVLKENKILNSSGTPVYMATSVHKPKSIDAVFYLITTLVLILAFLKFFFARYFTNLFRVFFNTSLRQSQLTDQLLQAKLPSLLFNAFFVVSAGIYTASVLAYFHVVQANAQWLVYGLCICIIGIVYVMKYCILKFTGWITGNKEITNTYIFIIFLISKIIGIFLVPFIILITFSPLYLVEISITISLLIIGLLFVLRFFRSYGLLQNQLKVSRFQFFLFIIGIELMPLLLIYKGLMILLSKNL